MTRLSSLIVATSLLWFNMTPAGNAASVARDLGECRLDLNGEWRVAFDRDNVGIEEQWFAGERGGGTVLRVPSCWEESPEGVGYDGIAWYEKSFEVPAEFRDKRLYLEFDAVNYACRVWVNGAEIGGHEGGYGRFRLAVGDKVDFDKKTVVTVRVVDPGLTPVDGLTLGGIPHGKESWYYNFGGIVGPVKLIGLPDAAVDDVFVAADPGTGKVTAEVEIGWEGGDPAERNLHVRITPRNNEGQTLSEEERAIRLEKGSTRVRFDLQVDNPTTWSLEKPFLYRLSATLVESSRKKIDFGFRSFKIENGDFLLNGKRTFIKAVLYQPYYPGTYARPPSDNFVRREVESIKQAGFNMVRFHQGPAPPYFLQRADERGLLVLEEPPLGWVRGSLDPVAKPCIEEVEAMVRRDRNHPCVVAWGTTSQGGGDLAQMVDLLARRIQQLDPTRPVFGDWPMRWAEASAGLARVYLPDRNNPVPIAGGQIFPPAPIQPDEYDQLHSLGDEPSLVFVSAIGSGGITNLERTLDGFRGNNHLEDRRLYEGYLKTARDHLDRYYLRNVYGSVGNLSSHAQRLQGETAAEMIEALRSNPKVDGYCYSQWRDGSWECGPGVVDVWGQYKQCHEGIRRANQPVLLALRCRPDAAAIDQTVVSTAEVVNDAGVSGRCSVTFVLRRPDGHHARVVKTTVRLGTDRRVTVLKPIEWKMDGPTGFYRLRAELKDAKGKNLADTETKLLYLKSEQWNLSRYDLMAFDPEPRRQSVLAAAGLRVAPPIEQSESQTVLISGKSRAWTDRNLFEHLARILAEINKEGGTLILDCSEGFDPMLGQLGLLKGKTVKTSRGFLGKFFFVRQSSRFNRLPGNAPMDGTYRTLVPRLAVIPPDAGWEPHVVVVDGYGRFIGCAWAEKRWGAGRIVVLTLPLFEILDRDPTARIVCANMLNHYKGRPRTGGSGRLDQNALMGLFDGKEEAASLLKGTFGKSPTDWLVCGPFECRDPGDGLRRMYPPEKEFKIDAVYQGPGGREVGWRKYQDARPGRIDFARALGAKDNAVGYAATFVYAEEAVLSTLRLGSDDAVRVYLNDHKVFENEVTRAAAPDQDRFRVVLKRGMNRLLLKVVNGSAQWEAYASLDHPVVWLTEDRAPGLAR